MPCKPFQTCLQIAILFMMATKATAQPPLNFTFTIDPLVRHQRVDGIGVNINTRSWHNDELKPALDLLADSMGAAIFRVIVETPKEWEDVNDNTDPFAMNWRFYDSVYETPKFNSAWQTIAYLNKKGFTNNVMINLMGYLPGWMGYETIRDDQEDEFVEMLVSFLYYGRKKKNLSFGLLSPFNEADWRNEGPKLDEKKYTRMLHKIIQRMDAMQLGDIRMVAPDPADMNAAVKRYVPEMMKDSLVMSRLAHIGVHSYGGYYANIDSAIKASPFPASNYWVTEWNAWRDSLDEGKTGVYDYGFAAQCVDQLLDLLNHGAAAALAWEGYDSYYDHHAPSIFSFWGILGYDKTTHRYEKRKHFYAISQVSKFLKPGAFIIGLKGASDSLHATAFFHPGSKNIGVIGVNNFHHPVSIQLQLRNAMPVGPLHYYLTDTNRDFAKQPDINSVGGNIYTVTIPPQSVFTCVGDMEGGNASQPSATLFAPPTGWYAGDIHVHRNCGIYSATYSTDSLKRWMKANRLSVMCLLADMGNGEVMDPATDLKKVTGRDDSLSTPDQIIHWDAEWHWDATYNNFANQALGGHLVLLGLKNANQIWEESPHKILSWAAAQDAVRGFAHMEYVEGKIPDSLNCCIPIDLPVEAALHNLDFASVDVYGAYSPNNGTYYANPAMEIYYKLLNCGIRLGLAAGTDFPCNEGEPLGTLLTYAKVSQQLSYNKWIGAIKSGNTVISRMGNTEFLDLKLNSKSQPGDELKLNKAGNVDVLVTWTSAFPKDGVIELICNGKVVQSVSGSADPQHALQLHVRLPMDKTCWIAARRMSAGEYQSHTAPVYVTLKGEPMVPDPADARYFVAWIDNLLAQTSPGGRWEHYFPQTLQGIRNRYKQARSFYLQLVK